jgi:hypothetical protein
MSSPPTRPFEAGWQTRHDGPIWRRIPRGLAIVLAWALFILWWREVLATTRPAAILLTGGVLAAIAALVATITLGWVAHNLRIARRGRRGSSHLHRELSYGRDFLQRRVELLKPELLITEPVIEIAIDGEIKRYVPGGERGRGVA